MKRWIDLAISVPLLAVATPVVGALAAVVRLTSKGPAFFAQTRVGLDKKPVRIFKLRTMVAGADKMGAHVTGQNDPRITRLGALLRATKLDELPQLWNVVRGDMSIVGPRPEAERYVQTYRPEWDRVFQVRPGITDMASIVFRHEESLLALARDRERAYVEALLPIKMRLCLEGIDRRTTIDQADVLLKTAAAVLRVWPRREHPAFAEARRAIVEHNQRVES